MAHGYATWPATGHDTGPCAVHAQARQETRPGRLAALSAAERVEEAGRQAAPDRAAEVEGGRVMAAPGPHMLTYRRRVRHRRPLAARCRPPGYRRDETAPAGADRGGSPGGEPGACCGAPAAGGLGDRPGHDGHR